MERTTNHFEESYIGKLWYIVLGEDKRSFNEFFSEEFGFTLDDDITETQLNHLVVSLVVTKNTYEWHKIQKLNKEMGQWKLKNYYHI